MWLCPSCGEAASFAEAAPWPEGWRCAACGAGVAHRDGVPLLGPALIGSDSGYDRSFFEALVRVEETSFWFVNRARLIARLLRRHFPHARTMLEIGCGTGSVLLALQRAAPELRLTGSELHPEGLAFARRRLGDGVALMQMDARAIPAREQFDVIGAFDVIEHIPEDEAVLRAMHAALKPGGGAIVAVPQHPWLWSAFDDAAHHQRRYRRGELEAKLRGAGFEILASTSFNAVLLPLMAASRLTMRLRGGRSKPAAALSELAMPRWLDGALHLALRLEVALTGAGLRWPAGGSRFVVARRPA